jgi:hypothetical protein
MWTYVQRTGELWHGDIVIGRGYSGAGEGKNNPAKEAVHDVGPIPCGKWEICGPPYDTTKHGPYVLRLEPEPGTITFGRTGFLMHGDSIERPGTASEGCIIQERRVRSMVWQSGDIMLEVVADLAPKLPPQIAEEKTL